MISRFISTGLSAVGRSQKVRSAAGFAKAGAIGTATVAGYGISAGTGYYSYGQDYGAGAGVLMGLGEAALFDMAISAGPHGWAVGAAAVGGYFAYQKGKEIYTSNRQVNMYRPFMDSYGTLNQMKMQSARSLSRDRSAMSRTLGNEARILHR